MSLPMHVALLSSGVSLLQSVKHCKVLPVDHIQGDFPSCCSPRFLLGLFYKVSARRAGWQHFFLSGTKVPHQTNGKV